MSGLEVLGWFRAVGLHCSKMIMVQLEYSKDYTCYLLCFLEIVLGIIV